MLARLLRATPPEDILRAAGVDRLLRATPPEDILRAAGVDRLLGSLSPEQRLADLSPEQRLLAMPVSALRVLPEEYLSTLPADVRAAIRRRIEEEK